MCLTFVFQGALDMKNKTAKDAMVPLPYVYMLDINSRLDGDTMSEVLWPFSLKFQLTVIWQAK